MVNPVLLDRRDESPVANRCQLDKLTASVYTRTHTCAYCCFRKIVATALTLFCDLTTCVLHVLFAINNCSTSFRCRCNYFI